MELKITDMFVLQKLWDIVKDRVIVPLNTLALSVV